jgi:hypothetical protein
MPISEIMEEVEGSEAYTVVAGFIKVFGKMPSSQNGDVAPDLQTRKREALRIILQKFKAKNDDNYIAPFSPAPMAMVVEEEV